jgi:hypothetical protein
MKIPFEEMKIQDAINWKQNLAFPYLKANEETSLTTIVDLIPSNLK